MSASFIFTCVAAYSVLLFVITWLTSRNSNNQSYFLGNKSSPWYIIAYGMIGASLSGVTFISVPGWVNQTQFSYLMVVLGYLAGYVVIATVLLPLYYRLNLTSIYAYLDQRFGFYTYQSGAFFFILSRVIGASFRMFLVVSVLQTFVFQSWGVPFYVTVLLFIALILLYTYEGGIKTIIWTDTLQTTFMLLGVIISVYIISNELGYHFSDLVKTIKESNYSQVIFTDVNDKRFFLKQFLSGMFITITMTGLDQEMMQKNLSCKSLKDAQKNMFSFSIVLVLVNFLFLCLGVVLYQYAQRKGIALPANSDELFPTLAINYLGKFAGIVFIIGLISAAYPSADGALTSLTTSFCVDILGINRNENLSEKKRIRMRHMVHIGFALLLFGVIVLFKSINDQAVVGKLFTVAGYTYGPLLGLYAFGLFTKHAVKDKLVPIVCILSPVLCYIINNNSQQWFNGYKFGFELLIVNGFITFIGLVILRTFKKETI